MEIKLHIKENHDQLSKYNTLFHDYIRRDPQGLSQSSYALLELNDPLFRLQPWPTFIGPKIKKEIIEANLNILSLLKNIPQRVFENDPERISKYYGISMDLAKYFLYGVYKEHLDNLLARGDFIITSNGIKCLEYNVNTNLGGMSLPLWESLYQATPIITEFINQNKIKIQNRNLYAFLYEHLAKAGIKFYQQYDEINTTVIMPEGYNDIRKVSQERYLNNIYNTALQGVYPGLKGQISMGTYSQLKVIGNDIFYNNRKVHVIVEWCQGFVPQNILELFKKRKIMICNGAIAWLMSTKLNLALLSEHIDSDLFTTAEKEIIEKHIPWTRKISDTTTTFQGKTIHLKEFILANREQLVLKPLVGGGGKDIFIGKHTAEKEWQELVRAAMSYNDWQGVRLDNNLTEAQWFKIAEDAYRVKNWLVQEYIEPPTYIYQSGDKGYAEHHAVWGFFFFGSTYSGGWLRVIPTGNQSGVINCHQGAKVSVVFEVDG